MLPTYALRHRLTGFAAVGVVCAVGCEDASGPGAEPGPCDGPTDAAHGLCLRPIATGLDWPLETAYIPGDERVFLVESTGLIRIVRGNEIVGDPFLDMSDRVTVAPEQGLLGLTFDPEYASTGELYVYYTNKGGDQQLDRYTVSQDPDRVDPESREPILTIPHTRTPHNGGWTAFGPDGYLWLTSGDGGVRETAQDLTDLRGAILRIDPRSGDPYAIPADNPFVGRPDARPEILHYGLRNPWRATIDTAEGLLYIGDVGEHEREELNIVAWNDFGLDFGWPLLEGSSCLTDPGCSAQGTVRPVFDYGHEVGCAIVGGHVYRGDALPALRGHYFYGDHCAGFIRSMRYQDGQVTAEVEYDFGDRGPLNSFGVGPDGEIYLLYHNGDVFRIEPASNGGAAS